MSAPSTPTSSARKFNQIAGESSNEGTGSWFEVIGGVMGDFLQNWGILSALKKRGWGTASSKSTSSLSPFNLSSSAAPEQIELAHFDQKNPCYLRVEGVWPAKGHDFKPTTLERPSWCDACAHLVFYHAITCHNCSFTCHEQCQKLVALDCKLASSETESMQDDTLEIVGDKYILLQDKGLSNDCVSSSYEDTVTGDHLVNQDQDCLDGITLKAENALQIGNFRRQHKLSSLEMSSSTLKDTVYRIQSNAVDSSEIEQWIQNCSLNNVGLQITKESDGSYRGCVRIHLNLSRPINIVAGSRPPSIYDILQEDRTLEKTLTSFYMPRDAVKAIHITNKTTTREVIAALLKKFKVVDNPQKFALYERTFDAGESMKTKLCRLSDNECPLVLAIAWNAQGFTNKRLVLQENDTADIQWEAFSLPELDNFLRILDKEELEYKNQIRDKYKLLKLRLETQLSKVTT